MDEESCSSEWEKRCRRCGRCCYEKVEYQGKYYLTDIPCQYLDPITKLCQVYPRRSQLRDGCVVLTPEIIAMGVLPHCCAYIQDLNYIAPQDWTRLPANILKSLKLNKR